jgi:hypothetical protein
MSNMDPQAYSLAMSVAANLGDDVRSETDAAAQTELSSGKGIFLDSVGVVLQGQFIVYMAALIVDLWRQRRTKQQLLLELIELIASDRLVQSFDAERGLRLIASLLSSHDATLETSILNEVGLARKTRAEWIKEWVVAAGLDGTSQHESTKKISPPVLVPFGDMKYYHLFAHMQWRREPSAKISLPPSIEIRKGFVTDLASIPDYLTWLLPPVGRYGQPAIIHDWMYWKQTWPRATADEVFDAAMQEMGVEPNKRRLIWGAVRLFGGRHWDANKVEKDNGGLRVLRHVPTSASTTWEMWRRQRGNLDND